MLSSLFRPKKARRRDDRSPYSSESEEEEASPRVRNYKVRMDTTNTDHDDSHTEETGSEDDYSYDYEDEDDDDEDGDDTPLLPIFSAAHLDALPVYNITHTIRLLVIQRCETTLTWDQLRSPQVSQFLVKPIQQQIRTSHFSRATLYALMANCLQFIKEGQTNPGNSGTSKTRAFICELLAVKLLKEFSTRELIDALSYDFNPLQGLSPPGTGTTTPGHYRKAGAPRISTLEIAIRAQAKRFLAHPVVVQQLEAIWAGTIVFHSSADSLHRAPPKLQTQPVQNYGATESRETLRPIPEGMRVDAITSRSEAPAMMLRRSVTLYDPRDASLFKLSRLRVPRYRQFLSTLSLAILLVLFVAVLKKRSPDIEPLEVVFWFWSAGFMLDEVVGFNEQGFSLYIMSFWNAFDLGILLLLMVYYCMRLYGILMPDVRRHHIANMAYDVLGANAVLLFPRVFSVLDHYRYFSQLLIAFRMMALDFVAVFILILISCSGFFIAFTLSFGENFDPAGVAYALFQIFLGFTPAAWELWPTYNPVGKAVLTLFLFICHFLIVTILITVLTNSFMAIVHNANEEHQFLFAVNAISMVKSDALFSYIAPSNILAWFLTPLRFVLPFRQYVRLNRTVIKITHFPVLFGIYVYEKVLLRSGMFEPTDLVEHHGRIARRLLGFEATGGTLFDPSNRRLREHSVVTFQKERALDEVFRRPFRGPTVEETPTAEDERVTSSHVVNNWIQAMGPNWKASPPLEQPRSIVERLESRRPIPRFRMHTTTSARDFLSGTRSVTSDPEEFATNTTRSGLEPLRRPRQPHDIINVSTEEQAAEHTDGDGDDELLTNDEDDRGTLDPSNDADNGGSDKENNAEATDYFRTPSTAHALTPLAASSFLDLPEVTDAPNRSSEGAISPRQVEADSAAARKAHQRMASTTTILYSPLPDRGSSTASPIRSSSKPVSRHSLTGSGVITPGSASKRGKREPRERQAEKDRERAPARSLPRPIPFSKNQFQSAPNLTQWEHQQLRPRRRRASTDFGSGSDGEGIARNQKAVQMLSAVPSSFATQMAIATGAVGGSHHADAAEDLRRMSRLMLTRMNALEESFRTVVQEVKDWKRQEFQLLAEENDVRRHQDRPSSSRWGKLTERRYQKRTRSSARKHRSMGDASQPHSEGDAGEGVETSVTRGTSV